MTLGAGEVGVVQLPSGRTVRGRNLRQSPEGMPADLTLLLAFRRPAVLTGQMAWIAWPDFGLPLDRKHAAQQLHDAWARSEHERVEVTCRGGRGRTGTALACIAALDGMRAADATALIRRQYDRRAIEMPWQARYVATFESNSLD